MTQENLNLSISAVAMPMYTLHRWVERSRLGLLSLLDKLHVRVTTIHARWQKMRTRQANLKFLGTLDSAVLRDVGLSKTDIALLLDTPLHFGRSATSYVGLLSFDHDLRRNPELLAFMSRNIQGGV